jgi:hypothetical protein
VHAACTRMHRCDAGGLLAGICGAGAVQQFHGDEGAHALATRCPQALEMLILPDNSISAKGVRELADALRAGGPPLLEMIISKTPLMNAHTMNALMP